jgi:putative endopeptidase
MHRIIFLAAIIFTSSFSFAQTQSIDDHRYRINMENFDLSVNPNEDFYIYTSGGWIRNNPIPDDESRWSSWSDIIEDNRKVLKEILENAASTTNVPSGSNLKKIGDIYFTAMNTEKIEKAGYNPIRDDLNRIEEIKTKEDFIREMAYFRNYWISPFFNMWSGQDDKNSENVIIQLSQGGLGMPDRDYYLKDDERTKKIREAYVSMLAKYFELTGDSPGTASKNANAILAMETKLAERSMSRVEMRDPDATYFKFTLQELKQLTPGFNWDIFFAGTGLTTDDKFVNGINVAQPEYFKFIDNTIQGLTIEDLKSYLKINLIRNAADILSSDFADEDFKFYNTVLRGIEVKQERWKQALNYTSGAMGEALGELFVARKFKPEAKAKALEMVGNIKEAFRERVMKSDWMSEITKIEAMKKLDNFKVKIGYPDKWRDYSALETSRESFAGNMKNASLFNFRRIFDKIGKPVDPNEWFMTPQTVNAYYSASKNEIVFPAGILQPPFYDPGADDALNYGGIGAVIGHEITHGFDDQGRKYDAAGNLNDWWTAEDAERFQERADRLAAQYDEYTVLDSLHVNGKLTLGENIADLGGLTIAYYGLMKTLEGKEIEFIDGFTPQQRFFISWTQVWRNNIRPEALAFQIQTDPHSPGYYRVNGPVSNMEEFIEAFQGTPGDKMIRAETDRVKIW